MARRRRASNSLKSSKDEDDPAGLSHCAQLDVRRYAQAVRAPL
jgi:hypothetical protein